MPNKYDGCPSGRGIRSAYLMHSDADDAFSLFGNLIVVAVVVMYLKYLSLM